MKNLLLIDDSFQNRMSYYLVILFLSALPFDQFYSEVVLITFIFHTLIFFQKKDAVYLLSKEFLVLISVFLLTMVCTIYTTNKQEAFNLWSRQSAIVLFPTCLFLNPIDLKKYAKNILLLFSFACTAVTIYLYIDAFRVIRYNHLPLSSLVTPAFLNHNFSEPIGIHATYLSLYVALSLTTLLYYSIHARQKNIQFIYLFCSCALLAGLIQLGSRATLVSFFIILFFVLPFSLTGKKRAYFLSISLLLSLLITITIIKVDSYRNRFLNELREDLSESSVSNAVTDSRMQRWDVAFSLVKKSPLIGYGAGDEADLLQEEYFSHKLYNAYLNKLNAHNQYISFLLLGGVFALAVFLFTLGFGLRLAIRSNNIFFTSFLLLIIIVSVSENVLSRNKGIFFYSFFFAFFVCQEIKRHKPLSKRKFRHKTGNHTLHSNVYTTKY